jgi:tetratricopeptide (TPR) repeat protein
MNRRKNSNTTTKNHFYQESETSIYSFVWEGLMLLSLAVAVFMIYSNTLSCTFIFDDVRNIQSNPHIRMTRLALDGITRAGFESPSSNRPIANISFALNYYFHGYNISGYHVVNILIHIATGMLLYVFAKTTLSIPSLRSAYGSYGWISFFTVCIWLVHPVHTQSVTYLVQRMNSMAAMFYVLSLLLYARARLSEEKRNKLALFAGCILTGILALGSKEIAATLPFFIFLYEWYFFRDLSWTWLKRHAFGFAGLLIIIAFVAFMFLETDASQKKLALYGVQDFTLPQRALTEFRVVILYISLLILPHPSRLNLEYDFPLSYSMVDPITTLLSMGAIGGLIGLAIYVAKRERLLSFCILWFLGNLVIESSVIGLALIFEHRTYLPSMLVSLMAVTLAFRYIKPKQLLVALLFIMMIVYSVWAYERNSVWSDEVVFWKDCVKKSPKNAGLHNNLGNALMSRGNIEEAIRHFFEALRIDPLYAEVHNNLGLALAQQGKHKEAISHYSEALRIKPDYAEAHNNLGLALADQGSFKEAISHYFEALRIDPDCAEAHNNLGAALARQDNIEEAIRHYTFALRINPNFTKAHSNLGLALKRQGRHKEAISHFSEALRMEPDSVEAHNNLGNTFARQGKLEDAMRHYLKALRIEPGSAEAHNNLGVALARQGRFKEAVSHFSEALRIDPGFKGARRNLERGLREMEKSSDGTSARRAKGGDR